MGFWFFRWVRGHVHQGVKVQLVLLDRLAASVDLGIQEVGVLDVLVDEDVHDGLADAVAKDSLVDS